MVDRKGIGISLKLVIIFVIAGLVIGGVVLLARTGASGVGGERSAGGFKITDFRLDPSEVKAGNPLEVRVNVKNTGQESSSRTLRLKIDGVLREKKEVGLAAGETSSVSFQVTIQDSGVHMVTVDNFTENLDVRYVREFKNIASADNRLIGAFYYPWYSSTRHWGEGYKGNPVLGEYSSRKEKVINKHIDWATGHGIDTFLTSWWGSESWEDETLRKYFLEADLADNISFCILYESTGRLNVEGGGIDLNSKQNKQILKQDFKYLQETYFERQNYLKFEGKPAVFLYLTRIFSGDVEETLESIENELGADLFFIGDQVYWQDPLSAGQKEAMEAFDAVTAYNMHTSVQGINHNFVEKVTTQYEEWRNASNRVGTYFIPNVMPGFDDTEVRPEADHPIIYRGKERFRGFCERVEKRCLDPDLGAVFVTSFNEWHEYTQVEPSENYGTTYLGIIKEKLANT